MRARLPDVGRVLVVAGLLRTSGVVPHGGAIGLAGALLVVLGAVLREGGPDTPSDRGPVFSAAERDVDGLRTVGLRLVGAGVLGLGWFAVVCAVIYAREGTLERLSIVGGLIQLVIFGLLLGGAAGLAPHVVARVARQRRVVRLRGNPAGSAGGVVVHRMSSEWFATDAGVPAPLRERLGPFAVDTPDVLASVAAVVGALLVPATYLSELADEPDRWAQIVLAGAAPVLLVVAGALVIVAGRRSVARRLAARDRAADEVRAGYPGHWADLARRSAPSTTGSSVPGEPESSADETGSEVLRARAQDLVRAVDHPDGRGRDGT